MDAAGATTTAGAAPPPPLDAHDRSWRGVTRLVFEWSFTKERRVERFRAAVAALEAAGFVVMYEGRGSWDELDEWPWHTDAIVFAAREL